MTPRVIKVSKKTLEMFKDARGVNDSRRASKIYNHYVSYSYFCKTFLPELKYCETKKEIDWVCDNDLGELFDEQIEDMLDMEIYYIVESCPGMGRLMWRCSQYSKEWKEVYYNTSSFFAMYLCELEDDCDSDPITAE